MDFPSVRVDNPARALALDLIDLECLNSENILFKADKSLSNDTSCFDLSMRNILLIWPNFDIGDKKIFLGPQIL